MGGNVGVIIKKANGERVAMNRWTNILPYFFSNVGLYKGYVDSWYEEFTEQWEEMRKDYEENKDTKKYKLNMTGVYFPHDTMSPTEYGLIAVDFAKKKIYSCQGYCAIGKVSAMNVIGNIYDAENPEETEEFHNFKQLYEAGFIKQVEILGNPSEIISLEGWSWDNVKSMLLEMQDTRAEDNFSLPQISHLSRKNKLYRSYFPIASEWKFSIRTDSSVALLEMKEEMEQDGFVFIPKDNAAWAEHLQYAYHDYEEKDATPEEKLRYERFCLLHKKLLGVDYVLPPLED